MTRKQSKYTEFDFNPRSQNSDSPDLPGTGDCSAATHFRIIKIKILAKKRHRTVLKTDLRKICRMYHLRVAGHMISCILLLLEVLLSLMCIIYLFTSHRLDHFRECMHVYTQVSARAG